MAKPVRNDAAWQAATIQRLLRLPHGGAARLARAIGVHEQSVSLWKAGKRPVPAEHREQIDIFLSDPTYVLPRQTSDTKSASSTPKEQGGHADATLVAQIGDLQREYQRIRSTLFDFKDTLDRFFKGGAAGHSVNTGRSSRVGGVADPTGKKARPSGTRPKTGEGSGGRRSDE